LAESSPALDSEQTTAAEAVIQEAFGNVPRSFNTNILNQFVINTISQNIQPDIPKPTAAAAPSQNLGSKTP
jgi:hypothetical protein